MPPVDAVQPLSHSTCKPVTRAGTAIDWLPVWKEVATVLRDHRQAGRAHLMTEDVLRFATALALEGHGVDPGDIHIEHWVPGIAAKLDLVVGLPPSAAVEFKYPRDPESEGAADTDTHGQLLRDLYRLAWLEIDDAWAVQVLDERLRGYLTRREEVDWSWEHGGLIRLVPDRVGSIAPTALRSLPVWTRDLTVEAHCEALHHVDNLLVAAFRVHAVRA